VNITDGPGTIQVSAYGKQKDFTDYVEAVRWAWDKFFEHYPRVKAVLNSPTPPAPAPGAENGTGEAPEKG